MKRRSCCAAAALSLSMGLVACATQAPPAGRAVPAVAPLAQVEPTPILAGAVALGGVLWVDNAAGELLRIDLASGATQRVFAAGEWRTQPTTTSDCALQAWMSTPRSADGAHADRYGIVVSGTAVLSATEEFAYADPALAPDGQTLFATRLVSPAEGIGSDVVRLSLGEVDAPRLEAVDAAQPAVSPDGDRLVYVAMEAKDPPVIAHQLVVRDVRGDVELAVVDDGRFVDIFGPRWLNEKQIVFTALERPVAAEGPTLLDALLGRSTAHARPPAHARAGDVWLVNVDGTGLRRLTAQPLEAPIAAPSPDGNFVAVLTSESIAVIGVDGADMFKMADVGGAGLAWCRAQ